MGFYTFTINYIFMRVFTTTSFPPKKSMTELKLEKQLTWCHCDSCVHHLHPTLLHHLVFIHSHSLCYMFCGIHIYYMYVHFFWLGSVYEGEWQLFFFLRLCDFAWCYTFWVYQFSCKFCNFIFSSELNSIPFLIYIYIYLYSYIYIIYLSISIYRYIRFTLSRINGIHCFVPET